MSNQGKALPPRRSVLVERRHKMGAESFICYRDAKDSEHVDIYIPLAEVKPLLDALLEARSYIPALYQQAHGRAWPANSSLKKQMAEALKNFKEGGV